MNGLGDTGQPWGLMCQVVDKDFYPLGGVFPFRAVPKTYIGLVANDIRGSQRMTISNLGLIDDPNNIDYLDATLWKLSKPYPLPGKGKHDAVENLLKDVCRKQQSLVEELDISMYILDYFDESRPRGHLHVLLQLSISGVDGAIPF